MHLIIEVVQDAKFLLNVKDLDLEETIAFYREAKLTPLEIYWHETLCPQWFKSSDPKLTI